MGEPGWGGKQTKTGSYNLGRHEDRMYKTIKAFGDEVETINWLNYSGWRVLEYFGNARAQKQPETVPGV